jgi:hypothetical protein
VEDYTPKRIQFTPISQGLYADPIQVASAGDVTGLFTSTVIDATAPPTSADLAETVEIQFTAAIANKAADLGHNPLNIYNWVRNNVDFVPTYGSIQGADYCLQTLECNAFDTSSLLIALLRASGIHARYAMGTVELDIDRFTNWVGGFTNTMAALDFASTGGIKTTGLREGGVITRARIEHVWVEAWVDMIPSMGAVHKVGDTWTPLDASFKQYVYTNGMDLDSAVPVDGGAFVNSAISSGTYDATESYIAGIDAGLVNSTLDTYQSQTVAFINQTNPTPTLNDVYGGRSIAPQSFRMFMGTLPYPKVNASARYSDLPGSYRHQVNISVSSNDQLMQVDPVSVTLPLPKVAGKKIALSYVSASDADTTIRDSYLGEADLPVYMVNVKAEVSVDDLPVATGSAMPMGTAQKLTVSMISPSSTNRIEHALHAGDYAAIGINTGMKTVDVDERAAGAAPENLEAVVSETLHQSMLAYWMENDMLSDAYARTFGVRAVRVPSEGIATTPIDLEYSFGVPVSGSYSAMAFDIRSDLMLVKAFDGSSDTRVKYNIVGGMISSGLEGSIFDQLFPEDTERGISAISLVAVALQSGIKVYGIDASNIESIVPKLLVHESVISEVRNAVNAGSMVIMPEATMAHAGWVGESYIAIDAQGNGAYMLSSGDAGGRKLMNMMTSFPAVGRPWVSELRQSLDDWLKKQGSSFAEAARMAGYGNTCESSAAMELPQSFTQMTYTLMNYFAGMFASEAEAVAQVCGPVAALAIFSVLYLISSGMLQNLNRDAKKRPEKWDYFTHFTNCKGFFGIMGSGRILAFFSSLWRSTYSLGIYLTDDPKVITLDVATQGTTIKNLWFIRFNRAFCQTSLINGYFWPNWYSDVFQTQGISLAPILERLKPLHSCSVKGSQREPA